MKMFSVKNAAIAAARVAGAFFTTGRIHVSDTDKANRLKICSACPHVIKLTPDLWQCGVCTCLLQVKAGLATEKCPKKLWIR